MNKKLLQLASLLLKLKKYELPDGVLVVEGELVVGAEALNEEGEPYADGEYTIEGNKVTVKDGKIEEIEAVEQPAKPEQPAEQEGDMKKDCLEKPEQPTEPKQPAEDEKDLKIKELEGLLADRDAMIEELNQKIKALEDKANAPVEEPVKMAKTPLQKLEVKENPALKYFQE